MADPPGYEAWVNSPEFPGPFGEHELGLASAQTVQRWLHENKLEIKARPAGGRREVVKPAGFVHKGHQARRTARAQERAAGLTEAQGELLAAETARALRGEP